MRFCWHISLRHILGNRKKSMRPDDDHRNARHGGGREMWEGAGDFRWEDRGGA